MNSQRLTTKRNPSTDCLLNKDVLFERLLDSLAERDHKLTQQLNMLNQNMLVLVQNSRMQSEGLCERLREIAQGQQRLIEVGAQLVELQREKAAGTRAAGQGLSKTGSGKMLIADYSQREIPPLDVRPELQRLDPPCLSARKPCSKEHQSDEYPSTQQKTASFPSRFALIPFQEKQLVVDISRVFQPKPTSNPSSPKPPLTLIPAQQSMSRWLAQVFDCLCRESFSGYFCRHLSESDSKIYYTYNLALNFQQMTEYFWQNHRQLWVKSGEELVEHFQSESSKVLDFMMVKYPLKQKAYMSDEIRSAIPTLDRSDEPEFDILRNTGCMFDYNPTRKEYPKQVKRFLNRIMTEAQSHLEEFRTHMKEVFTISDAGHMHQLKNLIGMKFRENTPLYSPKQIDDNGIEIKSPEVLRVIIKWIEQLEKKAKGLLDGTLIHNPFSTRESSKPQYLNRFMKEYLAAFMAKKEPVLKQAAQEMRLRIRSMLCLLPEFLEKYMPSFKHIKQSDVKSGLLSYTLAQTASNLSTNYLLFLIDLLEQSSKDAKRYEGTVQMTTTDNSGNTFKQTVTFFDMEFVTFTISDLLRCKCEGTLANIKKVFENLSKHPKFTIYRVKNRVDTSNKDFLVNVRLTGTPLLCEVQLAIMDKTAGDEKQEYLNHFSHFMYELSRASYGPIAQAVIINSYLTQFAPFFRKKLTPTTQPTTRILPFKVQCSPTGQLSIPGYVHRNNDFSFICSNCLSFRVANSSHLVNFDSSYSILAHDSLVQQANTTLMATKKVICGDCAYNQLSPEMQSLYMLGEPLRGYFQAVGRGKEGLPGLVCAVERMASVRRVRVLQRCTHGTVVSYVGTFYQCKADSFRVSEKLLKQKYYLFQLKPKVHSYYPDTQRLARQLQSSSPQLAIYLPALLPPSPPSPPSFPPSKPLVIFQNKDPSFLSSLQCKSVQVLDSPDSTSFLLINSFHSDEQLTMITKQGREFKLGEVKSMRVSQIWQLERSNLDNSSFGVFGDQVFVKEVNLQYNGLTDIHFVKSNTVRKIDLTGNHLQKLKLEIRDYPLLQFLNVSFNNVDRIEALEHQSLQTLLLSVNRISSLNESEWILPNLTRLYLTNNQITKIDLAKLSLLKELQLGDNPLEVIQFPPMMPKLEDFYLYKNKFSVLSLSKVSFPSLRRLHICECNLKFLELPRLLPCLEQLVLQNNNLPHLELPKDLSSLKKLNLQKNNLEFFDLSKAHMPYLKELNLRCNRLATIIWGKSMIRVQQIILTRNMLSNLDLTDLPLYSLQNLYLTSNYLPSLKFPPESPSPQTPIAPQLRGIYAANNLFALPIPSNVVVSKGRDFPRLETLQVGVENLEVCALWMLRRMGREEREGVYREVKMVGNGTGENAMERQLNGSWKEEDLGEEVRREAGEVIEILGKMGRLPKAHLQSIEEMQQGSHGDSGEQTP